MTFDVNDSWKVSQISSCISSKIFSCLIDTSARETEKSSYLAFASPINWESSSNGNSICPFLSNPFFKSSSSSLICTVISNRGFPNTRSFGGAGALRWNLQLSRLYEYLYNLHNLLAVCYLASASYSLLDITNE